MDDGKYLYPDLKKQAIYWGHSVILFKKLLTCASCSCIISEHLVIQSGNGPVAQVVRAHP